MKTKLWHISDPHLSIDSTGLVVKDMIKFGDQWKNWNTKLFSFWESNVAQNDIVLLGGDNAWPNRAYYSSMLHVGKLPGHTYFIDGNHCQYVHNRIKIEGFDRFKEMFKRETGLTYIGESFLKVGDTGILGIKLCDLPTNTFHSRFEKSIFIEQLRNLISLLEKHQEDLSSCKNRIILTHYPPVDDKLNYETSEWVQTVFSAVKPTHWLYGHYHSEKVFEFLKSTEDTWEGCKFLNTSFDLYDFKMRLVLDDIN